MHGRRVYGFAAVHPLWRMPAHMKISALPLQVKQLRPGNQVAARGEGACHRTLVAVGRAL